MGCLRYAAIAALAFLLSFMVVFSIIDLARAQETPAYEINPHGERPVGGVPPHHRLERVGNLPCLGDTAERRSHPCAAPSSPMR